MAQLPTRSRPVERAQEHVYHTVPSCPHWQVPDELQDKEFAAVLQEEPLQPLALEPLTEEEQVGPGLGSCSVGVGSPPQRGVKLGREVVEVVVLDGWGWSGA